MIEVPSAALTADLLADEADFFSIGTNDLIQYTLAVDRTDDRVSRLYEPLHPAILRASASSSAPDAAPACRSRCAARWRPIRRCCRCSSGLGLREFSMAPAAIPIAKQVVRGLRAADARVAAGRALRGRTAAEVEKALSELTAPAESRRS